MEEKKLITSFFLANAIDSTSSSLLLTQEGWQELNRFAFDKLIQGQFHEFIILKIAFSAVLIGCYALASTLNSRWEYPLEKSLRLGSLVVWGVQFWNAANVITALVR